MKRLSPLLILVVLAGGCETTPEFRSVVRDTYSVEAVRGSEQQIQENITVEDMGEAQGIVQPTEVQACNGSHLLAAKKREKDSDGNVFVRRVPVYEIVDPLSGIYLRRLRITNDTQHTLRLAGVDPVLVDGAGNDREGMDRETLAHLIRAARPCSSTYALIQTLESLKLLGADIRIRPGRKTTVMAAFSGVDKTITGDWTLELNDFSVGPDQETQVVRMTSFRIPLAARGFRTTIQQRREGMFSRWEEVSRSTEEIEP